MHYENELKKIFEKICGKEEMQYFQFSMFCEKYKLIDNKFNLNDIDNLFNKIRSGKKKTINFLQFEKALNEISKKRGKNVLEIIIKPKIKKKEDIKKKEIENLHKKKEILERQEELRKNQNINNEKKSDEKVREILEDMCVLGTIMKDEIIKEQKSNPDKFIPIHEAVKEENNKDKVKKGFFCLGVLAKNLEEIGVMTAIERNPKQDQESQNVSNTILQFIMNGMIEKKKYNLHFDLGESRNNELLNNKEKQKEFNEKIIKKISLEYKIPESEIILTNPQKGSYQIQLIFQSDEFNDINININQLKEKCKNDKEFQEISYLKEIHKKLIMEGCKLSCNMLAPEGNRESGWGEGEKRGGLDYFPPLNGWIGFGLKVRDKYDNGNNDWLECNSNDNEWAVAYHGIGCKISPSLEKASNLIIKGGFKAGSGQSYADDEDANHPGQKVGIGVYCSPDPNVMESYAKCFQNKNNY